MTARFTAHPAKPLIRLAWASAALASVALASVALASTTLAAAAADGPAPAAVGSDAERVLAPTGVLRVGVYRGSPSSIVEGPAPDGAKGVGYDLGRVLAEALGVPFRAVVFPANDGLLAAVAAGDVTFTNATAERGMTMDFSQTFMDVEKSFLVPDGSPLDRQDDFRRPGLRVGVSQGSSTATELRPLFPGLDLVPVATLENAVALLAAHRLDAFATNDAILFQMSDGLPGSRVVPGRWGAEHFAAAVPKGRGGGMPFVQAFVARAGRDGTVARAVARAGLRGTVPAGGG